MNIDVLRTSVDKPSRRTSCQATILPPVDPLTLCWPSHFVGEHFVSGNQGRNLWSFSFSFFFFIQKPERYSTQQVFIINSF